MSGLALIALLLSVLDASLTLYIVEHDLGVELNPLMALALHHSHGMFVGVKLAITTVCLWMLDRWCPRAVWCVLGLFLVVVCYSLWGLHVVTS